MIKQDDQFLKQIGKISDRIARDTRVSGPMSTIRLMKKKKKEAHCPVTPLLHFLRTFDKTKEIKTDDYSLALQSLYVGLKTSFITNCPTLEEVVKKYAISKQKSALLTINSNNVKVA